MRNTAKFIALVVVIAAVFAGAGYWFGRRGVISHGDAAAGAETSTPRSDGGEKKDRKILYWHDPMYPQQKFDKPGKSPYMDMQLVPVYADGEDEGKVRISPRLVQNLGVRTVEATTGALKKRVEAVGTVAFDERAVAVLQARVTGYVEKLYVRAPLDPVRRGQALAQIHAPDWVAAQEEYVAVLRMSTAKDPLRQAARARLVLLGVPESVIAGIERDGVTQSRVTITAPIDGVIAELGAREGMAVAPGSTLFRINGLATVWVNAEVPETQAGWVKPAAPVEARVAAYPGQTFTGKVATLLPEVNPVTRTIKARIELKNPQGRLKPGMFATVDFAPRSREETVLVPTSAVIQTGERSVVIVAEGEGKFQPADVEAGAEADGQTEIRRGVKAGQRVVVSGQFLIDSEASLKGTLTRMGEMPAMAGKADESKKETKP